MKPTLKSLSRLPAIMLAGSSLAGCCSGTYRTHEGGSQTQGTYLNAMFADIDATTLGQQQRLPFTPPASVAVVEVGEISPPAAFMDRLRSHADLFCRVEAIPATGTDDAWRWKRGGADPSASIRSRVNALRNMAASVGADYLLLVGGTVDQSDSATNLSLLNLTVIGAFVIPSQETRIVQKSSGALIDVRTGQVVSISSAEASDHHMATLASADGDTDAMIARLSAQASTSLADAVAVDCVRVGKPTPVISSNLVPPVAGSPANTASLPPAPAWCPPPGVRLQGH